MKKAIKEILDDIKVKSLDDLTGIKIPNELFILLDCEAGRYLKLKKRLIELGN